jgi:hypothetical protein
MLGYRRKPYAPIQDSDVELEVEATILYTLEEVVPTPSKS